MSQTDPVKQQLIHSDKSFRSLYEEHLEYKRKLGEIRDKPLASEEDELEIKRIKLHKLALKDQMEAMLRTKTASAS